jgi:hypothetical protein
VQKHLQDNSCPLSMVFNNDVAGKSPLKLRAHKMACSLCGICSMTVLGVRLVGSRGHWAILTS